MAEIYQELKSSDKSNIFDVNQDQKHIRNQLIHFVSINWKELKNWYCKCCHSTMNKNSSACFVYYLGKNFKIPTYNIDFVQNIHDDNNKNWVYQL